MRLRQVRRDLRPRVRRRAHSVPRGGLRAVPLDERPPDYGRAGAAVADDQACSGPAIPWGRGARAGGRVGVTHLTSELDSTLPVGRVTSSPGIGRELGDKSLEAFTEGWGQSPCCSFRLLNHSPRPPLGPSAHRPPPTRLHEDPQRLQRPPAHDSPRNARPATPATRPASDAARTRPARKSGGGISEREWHAHGPTNTRAAICWGGSAVSMGGSRLRGRRIPRRGEVWCGSV